MRTHKEVQSFQPVEQSQIVGGFGRVQAGGSNRLRQGFGVSPPLRQLYQILLGSQEAGGTPEPYWPREGLIIRALQKTEPPDTDTPQPSSC